MDCVIAGKIMTASFMQFVVLKYKQQQFYHKINVYTGWWDFANVPPCIGVELWLLMDFFLFIYMLFWCYKSSGHATSFTSSV